MVKLDMAQAPSQFRPSQILYYNDLPTPLGQITTVGVLYGGTGTERGVMRIYGAYAVVYFLEGTGEYCDTNGFQHQIIPGDLVLVTPELPHRYTTRPGRYWSECYLIFDGPIFDLCHTQGILNSAHPVVHLEPIALWQDRLLSVVTDPSSQSLVEKAAEVSRLLALLLEIYVREGTVPPEQGVPAWLAAAKAALDANMGLEIDLKVMAGNLGVSYETFRKGFQKQYGISPGLYRTRRRIASACQMLKLTTLTHQQIAAHLGFSDEFHFSKRFKQVGGVSPSEYRKQNIERHPSVTLPPPPPAAFPSSPHS